jgi:hypothetical protein
MRKIMKSLALVGVVLGFATVSATTHAWTLERTMLLTFSRAVALPGVELGAGTYIFELANPGNDPSAVRVSSPDRRIIYTTMFTNQTVRPASLGPDQVVSFGESRNGAAPRITAWFPDGSNQGRQFIYHK